MTAVYELKASMHDQGGNFVQNVFRYQLSEAGAHTPFEYAERLIAAFVGGPEGEFFDLMGLDVIVDFYTAKKISGTGGPSATLIKATTATGAAVSTASGLAADIQWQTASGNNRPGHSFIGLIPDGSFQSGFYQGGFPAKCDAFITAMLTQLTLTGAAGTADFGIYTRVGSVFNHALFGQLRPKPTMLNKRTLPVI
jgi:hypothetical protein